MTAIDSFASICILQEELSFWIDMQFSKAKQSCLFSLIFLKHLVGKLIRYSLCLILVQVANQCISFPIIPLGRGGGCWEGTAVSDCFLQEPEVSLAALQDLIGSCCLPTCISPDALAARK